MKRRLLSGFIVICMSASLLSGCGKDEENETQFDDYGEASIGDNAEVYDIYDDGDKYFDEDEYYEDEYYYEDDYEWSWEDFKDSLSDDYIEGGAKFTERANAKADSHVDADSFTVMIYMCGSNLESEAGCATRNLNQMIYSDAGDNLKIVIETGGANKWQNDVIASDRLQRYLVGDEGIYHLQDAGKGSICDTDELADFIKYTAKEYPADRYGFIFWDHGGGTIGGYGVDELYGLGMSNEQVAEGFKKSGVHFDFIGYDCCLMSTLEIANSLAGYADYLIASEETEPGSGWYYTNFLNLIENDPGVPMKEIGKQIIDDYNSDEYTDDDETTLALVDLSQIPSVVDSLNKYMANASVYLRDNGYEKVARARSNVRSYGENNYEQIDIIDYLDRLEGVEGTGELRSAVENAVLYNGTQLTGSNGLAMYFPYLMTEDFSEYKETTQNLGLSDELYEKFFDEFVSLMTGSTGGGSNPYAGEQADYSVEDMQDEAWYDEQLVAAYEDYYSQMDSNTLEIVDKDGTYVLQLSEDDWSIVDKIELQVYLNDEDGYLSLGSDDFYEFDDDGDLIVDYDFNWLYVNDCLAPYQAFKSGKTENGQEYSLGYSQAYLNDDNLIKVWIKWVGDSCTILGYTPYVNKISSKGYFRFKEGDIIDFAFDYYTNDGEYEDSYTMDDNYIVYSESEGIEAYYDELDSDAEVEVNFYITDIYQNEYWTEPITYSPD